MKKEVIKDLESVIDYIENHSISKLDLLLYLQELHMDEKNDEVVKGFYQRFFSKKDKDDQENER